MWFTKLEVSTEFREVIYELELFILKSRNFAFSTWNYVRLLQFNEFRMRLLRFAWPKQIAISSIMITIAIWLVITFICMSQQLNWTKIWRPWPSERDIREIRAIRERTLTIRLVWLDIFYCRHGQPSGVGVDAGAGECGSGWVSFRCK